MFDHKPNYLSKIDKEVNKSSLENNIPKSEAEFITDCIFQAISFYMNDPTVPKIILPYFGTFKLKRWIVDRKIKMMIWWRTKKGISTQGIRDRLRYLLPLRKRLKREEAGEVTHYKWRTLKKRQEMQNLRDAAEEQKTLQKNKKVHGANNNGSQ